MCDPVTAAYVVVGVAAAGGYASYEQGRYQDRVARANAKTARWQAEDALRRGEIAAAQKGRETRYKMGLAQANFGAASLNPNYGSPLAAINDIAQFGFTDQRTISANAQRESFGYQMNAINFLAQGDLAHQKGVSGAVRGGLRAVSAGFGAYGGATATSPLSTTSQFQAPKTLLGSDYPVFGP